MAIRYAFALVFIFENLCPALDIMPFTSERESNTTRTIPKRERRCVPWVSKTYDDEKVLEDIHRSHPEKSWNVLCDKYNEMVPSYRQRSVDAVYSKWKTLRLRSRNTPTSTSLTSKESFTQARAPQELVQQMSDVSSSFFTKSFLLKIHLRKHQRATRYNTRTI